jgi:hypothetical protein
VTSADEVVDFHRKAIEAGPTSRIKIDHAFCDDEWAGMEIWIVDTNEPSQAAPRFGVFHRWVDAYLAARGGCPHRADLIDRRYHPPPACCRYRPANPFL